MFLQEYVFAGVCVCSRMCLQEYLFAGVCVWGSMCLQGICVRGSLCLREPMSAADRNDINPIP